MTFIIIGWLTIALTESTDGTFSPEGCALDDVDFSLNLTDVGLRSLPNGFVENEFLTRLILDDNQIAAVSSTTFSSVPRLSYLSLANNKLAVLSLQPFSELDHLETLILNGNCRSRTPADYNRPQYVYIKMKLYDGTNFCSLQLDSRLPSLRYLFVEDNSLQKLLFTSGQLPMLTHLYLAKNQLKMDEDTVLGLKRSAPALTHLYLNQSGILEFNASELPTITSLYLDQNDIRTICNEHCESSYLRLKDTRKLETLSIAHNQISQIEVDAFNHTVDLITLDLSHNKISAIRQGTFDKLRMLQYLSLEYNNLAKLDEVYPFRGLINLMSLFLGNNNITTIAGRVFENLTTLKILRLNHNRISTIDPGTFSNLSSLEELSIADNQLERIPEGSMPSSGSLITLNLDNNRFTSVEHISIANAPLMLSLSLKDNPLTGMTSRWFSAVPPNLNIVLGSSCYPTNQSQPSAT